MRTNELMLYKHMEEGQILQDMTFLMENYQNDYYNMEDMKGLLYDAVNEILEMAVSHGFEGPVLHSALLLERLRSSMQEKRKTHPLFFLQLTHEFLFPPDVKENFG